MSEQPPKKKQEDQGRPFELDEELLLQEPPRDVPGHTPEDEALLRKSLIEDRAREAQIAAKHESDREQAMDRFLNRMQSQYSQNGTGESQEEKEIESLRKIHETLKDNEELFPLFEEYSKSFNAFDREGQEEAFGKINALLAKRGEPQIEGVPGNESAQAHQYPFVTDREGKSQAPEQEEVVFEPAEEPLVRDGEGGFYIGDDFYSAKTNLSGTPEFLQDKTPLEWKEELKNAVNGIVEQGSTEKETISALQERLANRSKELDAELEKVGRVEKGFRWIGEKYNKLGWKSKLAVGLSLGIGAGVGAAVSMPLGIACLSGIAAQRIAGMSSMFLKFESKTADGKWKKEKAMGKAIAWTAGMTGAMLLLSEGVKEGVQYANQHHVGESVKNWLGHVLGHSDTSSHPTAMPSTPEVTHPTEAPAGAPEVHHDVPPSSTPEVATPPTPEVVAPPAPEVAPVEMPSVAASTGHGYEYMAKRLWQQLQDKHLDPRKYAADSDMHKLLTADAHSIDKVVHQIAIDPEHAFSDAAGTKSVIIGAHANMTIGTDGQIHLSDSMHADAVHAAEEAHTTPTYVPHHDAQVTHVESPISSVESQAHIHIEPATPAPEVSSPVEPVTHAPEATVPAATLEAPSVPVEHITINPLGIEVPQDVSHIYADVGGKHLFAYGGGDAVDAQAQEYALANHTSVFVDKSYKLLGFIYTPRVLEYQPDGTIVFHNDAGLVPSPDNFEKIIK